MFVQIPYSDVLMFLVSRRVKMSPVATLKIWDAKMMKPEYWTLIVCLLKFFCFFLVTYNLQLDVVFIFYTFIGLRYTIPQISPISKN